MAVLDGDPVAVAATVEEIRTAGGAAVGVPLAPTGPEAWRSPFAPSSASGAASTSPANAVTGGPTGGIEIPVED